MEKKHNLIILKALLFAFVLSGALSPLFAVGEASTYFEIFVPPNNNSNGRDVCLTVTAIFDNTSFSIVDDNMDGDDDDSVSGVLQAGQSYILYIRDNGINDDAPHSGESASKQDGDYFIVESDNLVLTSQSTNSDWQHDWVPATNKSSKGKKFIIYSPPTSYSNRDLNVFTYEDSTQITVKKISWAAQNTTGYTNVDITQSEIVLQQSLNVGEDIIFNYTGGRDLLEPGETYLVESSKEITTQYGALWVNARDGGGYVPSANGSSSGELFYFTVPYQSSNEQEVRIVSWDDAVSVSLDKYVNNAWVNIETWELDALETADWVSYTGNVNAVLRIKATADKKVSVFEANWLETGAFGTSDIATMVSSRAGTTAGNQFLVYMAPPGMENNVNDPFTGEKLSQYSHLYLFSREDAVVRIVDAYTRGEKYDKTFSIEAGRYVDCRLDVEEWKNIYNGDGEPESGPERPYLLVEADVAISVFNTNFNDNWMTYFGTSQYQDFKLTSMLDSGSYSPGDTLTVSTGVTFNSSGDISSPEVEIVIQDGAEVISSVLVEQQSGQTTNASSIEKDEDNGQTKVTFTDLGDMAAEDEYVTETQLKMNTNYIDGSSITDGTVITAETIISGYVDGVYQQATSSEGITNNTANQEALLFTQLNDGSELVNDETDSWSVSVADMDNDGKEDIIFSDYEGDRKSYMYLNSDGGFVSSMEAASVAQNDAAVSAAVDFDNDGDMDLVLGTNLDREDELLQNKGRATFRQVDAPFNTKGYTHGVAFADVDNNGFVDVFISDYMPTQNNQLYMNEGGESFDKERDAALRQASYSIGAVFADYDNDGDADLFVPNDKKRPNLLYTNNGAGKLNLEDMAPFSDDAFNSTGASWGDYDNDGDLDLFVANAGNQNNNLYKNNGNQGFEKITSGQVVNDGGNSHGSVWVDLDNDGDLDLFVTNDQDEINFLYLNNGDGSFQRDDQQVLCARNGNSFATAAGDINDDGFQDIVVATHSGEANQVFINNANDNSWLKLKLTGTNSNRQALGARVRAKASIGGVDKWQMRQVLSNTGGGANAQSSLVCHFGLGDATTVDSIIIDWPSGYRQVIKDVTSNQSLDITEDDGAMVSGLVFNDENTNCIYDEGEDLLAHMQVQFVINNELRSFYTDEHGKYNAYLTPGDYVLNVVSENWEAACDDYSDQLVVVEQLGDSLTDYHIGAKALVFQPDLRIDITSTAFRRGFEKSTYISISNHGTVPANNVKITLNKDAFVHPLNASMAWDSVADQMLMWNFASMNVNEEILITLHDSVGLEAQIADAVTLLAQIECDEVDMNPEDNTTLLTDSVVGSLDPNDILVSPNGKVLPGTTLEFTIRFQNVGNYPADFVVVTNHLPDYVDKNSFEVVAASHSYALYENEEGMKEWFFEDIQLADSVSNEPESHGFIKYLVDVKSDLDRNVTIRNFADIVFDYNEAIRTNTTVTPVLYFSGDSDNSTMMLYPNPATDRVNLAVGTNQDMVPMRGVELINASGVVMVKQSFSDLPESAELTLNVLPGIYYVRVFGVDGKVYTNYLSVE